MFVKSVTDSDFENDVLKAKGYVPVVFGAEWFVWSQQLEPRLDEWAPMLDELAQELGEKILIVKVNIDESPQTAQSYGVCAIPTPMFFKGGRLKGMRVGTLPKSRLLEWLDENA